MLKQRRAAPTPEMTFLRQFICPLVWGLKRETVDEEGTIIKQIKPTCNSRPFTTKELLQAKLNDRHERMPRLANYHLDDHFNDKATLYFGGHHDIDHDIISMIDIDVEKSKNLGSPEGAKRFAEYLDNKPELKGHVSWEPSTHQKGQQGFFVLRCAGIQRPLVNAQLKDFEAWLRAEAEKVGADIELVEVKGSCPIIKVTKGQVRDSYEVFKFGCWAKIPRKVRSLMNTQPIGFDDLPTKIDLPEIAPAVKNPKEIVAGSVSGKAISEEDLGRMPGYMAKAERLLAGEILKGDRWAVTFEDIAQFLVLALHFRENPGPGGAVSVRQFGKLWTALVEAGDFKRPWNHHRFKAIRDWLSALGHIQWDEHRYIAPIKAGEAKVAGKACIWRITDELAGWLQGSGGEEQERSRSCVDTIPVGTGQFMVPILWGRWSKEDSSWWAWAYKRLDEIIAA